MSDQLKKDVSAAVDDYKSSGGKPDSSKIGKAATSIAKDFEGSTDKKASATEIGKTVFDEYKK